MSEQPMLMDTEQAAERLGVNVSWLRHRTGKKPKAGAKKLVPHRKVGHFVRFTEDDLRAICEMMKAGK